MMAVIKKTPYSGLVVMLGAFAFTQSVSRQAAPDQSERVQYGVVLGSYVSRDIALRELAEFSSCKQPVFIPPISLGDSTAVRTMYRVVDESLAGFDEAQIFMGLWLSVVLKMPG
jgi:hypothetical protein